MRAPSLLIALFFLGCGGSQPAATPAPSPPVVTAPPPRSAGPPGPVEVVYAPPATTPTTTPATRTAP